MTAHHERQVGNVSLEDFSAVLAREAERPIAGDLVIGACSAVLHELIQTDPEVTSYYQSILADNHYEDADHLNNLNFKAIQAWIMGHPVGVNYPAEYYAHDTWRQVLPQIFNHHGAFATRHWMDLKIRQLNVTNVVERYVTYPLLDVVYPGRFTMPSAIDFGTSQIHGPKQLKLERRFHPLTVMPGPKTSTSHAHELTGKLDTILKHPLRMGDIIGVDLFKVDDVLNAQWARTSRVRPKEIEEGQVLQAYDELDRIKDIPGVYFIRGDVALNEFDPFKKGMEKPVDWASIFTMMYQLPADERQITVENAKKCLTPGGLVIVQDSMKLKKGHQGPALINDFNFSARGFSEDFGYTTWVHDMANPEAGFIELWRFTNARCQEIQFADSKLALRAIAEVHRRAQAIARLQ